MRISVSLASALLATSASAIVAPTSAFAQTVAYNIPASDLDSALQKFALTSNREILYSPTLVANQRTAGISGSFTPEEALRRLLSGTDLRFSQPRPNVFVLQRGSVPAIAARTAAAGAVQPVAAADASVGRGAVTGVVTDGTTGTPLAGARMSITGTNLVAATDERGEYRFPSVPAGEYEIVLDYLGDPPQQQSVIVAAGSESVVNFIRVIAAADEIVVVGYTSGIQRALNRQRTAPNASTVVSEDFLGGFPAETVSEALRRVPGVAFGRDEASGEGSRITVRGFGSEAINVQVNGLELQGTNFERTIDLSGYLADNISEITIHKSLLPSHEATGSGGLVEIETRSGLDYGDFHLSGSVEGERPVESGFGREYQVTGTIGGKITPNFGAAATISFRDTHRRNNDIGIISELPPVLPAGSTSVFRLPASFLFPFDPEFNNRLITSVNYSQRERDETNLLGSLNLAWDIADHTRLRLDMQRNEREATNYVSRANVGFLRSLIDMPIPELGGEVRRRAVLTALRPILGTTATDLDVITNTISFRGDTTFDRWQFRYKAGYSGARSKIRNDTVNFLGQNFTDLDNIIDPDTLVTALDDDAAMTERVIGGGFVELPNGAAVPSLTEQGFNIIFDPATYRLTSAFRAIGDSPTDAYIAEASARYSFETWLDYVEVGAKWDRNERTAVDDLFTTSGSTAEQFISIFGRDTFISDLGAGLLTTEGLGELGLGSFGIPFISESGNDAIFEALEGLTADDPSTPFNEERFRFTDIIAIDPLTGDPIALAPAASSEERLAGYLEGHVEFGKFDIVGGARVERTRRVGTNLTVPQVTLNLPGFQREPTATFVEAGLISFEDLVAVDTTITPSFLINYRPTTNIVARLGYFRSTVHPSLQLLRRGTQLFIDLRPSRNVVTLREGNADLEPTVTDNFDLDVAYYFQDSPGLIRAAAFYKNISNNFTNVFVQDQPAPEIRQRVLDFFGPLATSRPDLVAFNDDTSFLLSRPINGEGGKIWGFELEAIRQFDFLPGYLSGLGVIGNVTYTAGDFPTIVSGVDEDFNPFNVTLDRPLADQAEWVYNAALTYSRGGFEGRLIYTKQTESVVAYDIHDLNTVIPGYSTLDLRMSYNFEGPRGGLYTLFLEGDDLLRDADEADIRSATANTRGRSDADFFFPDVLQFSGGRTITLGARVRF